MTDDIPDEFIEEALRLQRAVGPDATYVRQTGCSWSDATLAHARTLMEVREAIEEYAGQVFPPPDMSKSPLGRFLKTQPDPDEELAREAIKGGQYDSANCALRGALATIKALREQGWEPKL